MKSVYKSITKFGETINEDAAIANAIDAYGFGKLGAATQSFTLTTDPIADINAFISSSTS